MYAKFQVNRLMINSGIFKKVFVFLLFIVLMMFYYIYIRVTYWQQGNEVLPFHDGEVLPIVFKMSKLDLNSYNFSIIESPRELCDSSLDMLFMVTSAPKNLKARNAIRRTWGSVISADRYKVVFLVATTEDPKINHLLREEQKSFNDLVQADFIDSYYDLTLKSILMLRWINESCPKIDRLVVKIDDDTFLNIPLLLHATKTWNEFNYRKRIYGQLVIKGSPWRDPKSKWYVSKEQYPDPYYPDFVFGPMYLITIDSIRSLYATALETSYLYLEDVFLTGIVAEKAGIKRYNISQILNDRGNVNICEYRKYIAFHYIPTSEMYKIWAALNDGSISKCKGEPNVDIFDKAFVNFDDQY